jgi:RNA polymerase sigma-70 factor (ECF subfamily)
MPGAEILPNLIRIFGRLIGLTPWITLYPIDWWLDLDRIERSNEQWLNELRQPEPHANEALQDLRSVLERGLGASVGRTRGLSREEVEDLAQDSLVKILRKLDTFQGKSRFTTWALRVAMNSALSELRKRRWSEMSLDKVRPGRALLWSRRLLSGRREDPERRAMQRSMLKTIERTVQRELTKAQKRVFVAVQLEGMPLGEVARQLGASRGTLYKRMHDARRRIKSSLQSQGLSYDDFAAVFQEKE